MTDQSADFFPDETDAPASNMGQTPYSQTYAAQMSGEADPRKAKTEANTSPKPLSCLFGILAIPLACCGLIFAFIASATVFGIIAERNEVTRTTTQSLPIENLEAVTLVVENQIGEVSIRGDDVAEIQVEVESRATGITSDRAENVLDALETTIERDDDTYRVIVSRPDDSGSGSYSSDMRITVPHNLNLNVQTTVASITVRDVTVPAHMDLITNVGQVEFEGVLRGGEYRIETNTGEIEVTLEEGSAVTLEATSEVGRIQIDADLQNRTTDDNGVGNRISGSIGGSNPDGTLTIITNVGRIEVKG